MTDPFKVLIAVDNSDHADFAFQYYMKHIHKADNELVLLHVAELPGTSISKMSGAVWEEVVQREKDKSIVLEKDYRTKLEKYKLSAKIIANFANKPGETICKTAEDEGAYMIVMGSRGSGKVRRTIMGSVSDYVMHHSHCPVVVCRHESHHHGSSGHSFFARLRKHSSHSESERERKNSDCERVRTSSESGKHRHSSGDKKRHTSSGSDKNRHTSTGSDKNRHTSGSDKQSAGSQGSDGIEVFEGSK